LPAGIFTRRRARRVKCGIITLGLDQRCPLRRGEWLCRVGFKGLRELAIKELALANESFRSICSDFAAAESALNRFSAPSSDSHEDRRREYEVLIAELMSEISDALDEYERRPDVNSENAGD
jgi:hypothetical protein